MKRKIHDESDRKWRARKARTAVSVSRSARHRVMVFRSSKHIYAQLIDPETGRTLGAVSSRSKAVGAEGLSGVETAKKVGVALAELAKRHQVSQAVFNRNGFLYHGRVKALAEAAREAGLQL